MKRFSNHLSLNVGLISMHLRPKQAFSLYVYFLMIPLGISEFVSFVRLPNPVMMPNASKDLRNDRRSTQLTEIENDSKSGLASPNHTATYWSLFSAVENPSIPKAKMKKLFSEFFRKNKCLNAVKHM